jgi:uncharacterized protein YdbL (DUF1318 family)
MKKLILVVGTVLSLATASLMAADAKSYQVTGPVLEINDTYIVVQKGEDKWQLACDKATKGAVKVGDKVTIQYQMVAKSVEVKPAKAEKPEKPAKK